MSGIRLSLKILGRQKSFEMLPLSPFSRSLNLRSEFQICLRTHVVDAPMASHRMHKPMAPDGKPGSPAIQRQTLETNRASGRHLVL